MQNKTEEEKDLKTVSHSLTFSYTEARYSDILQFFYLLNLQKIHSDSSNIAKVLLFIAYFFSLSY